MSQVCGPGRVVLFCVCLGISAGTSGVAVPPREKNGGFCWTCLSFTLGSRSILEKLCHGRGELAVLLKRVLFGVHYSVGCGVFEC